MWHYLIVCCIPNVFRKVEFHRCHAFVDEFLWYGHVYFDLGKEDFTPMKKISMWIPFGVHISLRRMIWRYKRHAFIDRKLCSDNVMCIILSIIHLSFILWAPSSIEAGVTSVILYYYVNFINLRIQVLLT